MRKLESLVPPLDLCQQIPAGKFADSALVWAKFPRNNGEYFAIVDRSSFALLRARDRYPAPTLQEILEALGAATCYHLGETWTAALCNDSLDNGAKDANPATAALKLWLEINANGEESKK